MPRFTAIILVELDEDTTEDALEVAKAQVHLMEENAQTNGFARVYAVCDEHTDQVSVSTQSGQDLCLPEGCFVHDGYCTIENCQNPEHDEF